MLLQRSLLVLPATSSFFGLGLKAEALPALATAASLGNFSALAQQLDITIIRDVLCLQRACLHAAIQPVRPLLEMQAFHLA